MYNLNELLHLPKYKLYVFLALRGHRKLSCECLSVINYILIRGISREILQDNYNYFKDRPEINADGNVRLIPGMHGKDKND